MVLRAMPGAPRETCVGAARRTSLLVREQSSKSGRRGESVPLSRLQQQQQQQRQQQLLGVMCRGRGVALGSSWSGALFGGVTTTAARSFRAGEGAVTTAVEGVSLVLIATALIVAKGAVAKEKKQQQQQQQQQQ